MSEIFLYASRAVMPLLLMILLGYLLRLGNSGDSFFGSSTDSASACFCGAAVSERLTVSAVSQS